MKGFFYGLTAGLAAGIVAQMMIARNHEQMLELVRNLPRPLKFGPSSSLDELLAQKDMLEDLIMKKQTEATAYQESDNADDSVDEGSEDDF
ncbi:MAG: hypothetical protein GY866_14215 [Proteobacteria bacterium]|nr:hypothetical protein [Pseudomonadota bacterium]